MQSHSYIKPFLLMSNFTLKIESHTHAKKRKEKIVSRAKRAKVVCLKILGSLVSSIHYLHSANCQTSWVKKLACAFNHT